MNQYLTQGKICQGIGGQYTVKLVGAETHEKLYPGTSSPLAGMTVQCFARGKFRHTGITPLCGDNVVLSYTDASVKQDAAGHPIPDEHGTDMSVDSILERRNCLIRPAMANLDAMLIVSSVSHPSTPALTLDKLTAIAVHNQITPFVIITKSELDPSMAQEMAKTYASVGFDSISVSAVTGDGIPELRERLRTFLPGKISCFTGMSGVGKSTLMNLIFPDFNRKTGAISERIQRGKNTTREITLYDLTENGYHDSWLADTPGFSMIDFEHFDFMELDDLFYAFPEFVPYLGKCRYQDCAHVKEQGCAILEAVKNGVIPQTRHESYVNLHEVLKDKHPWNS